LQPPSRCTRSKRPLTLQTLLLQQRGLTRSVRMRRVPSTADCTLRELRRLSEKAPDRAAALAGRGREKEAAVRPQQSTSSDGHLPHAELHPIETGQSVTRHGQALHCPTSVYGDGDPPHANCPSGRERKASLVPVVTERTIPTQDRKMRAPRADTNIAEMLSEGPCDLSFHGTRVGRRFTKANGRDGEAEEGKFPSLPGPSRPMQSATACSRRHGSDANWQVARTTVAH
jgi:hypothetical protein